MRVILAVAAVLIVISAAFVVLNIYQKPITFGNGFGWDGGRYGNISLQFILNREILDVDPFARRLLTPYIVSKLYSYNQDAQKIDAEAIRQEFARLNIFASILSSILLTGWLALRLVYWRLAALLGSLYVLHWLGPLRFAFYYPTLVDSLTMLGIMSFLLISEWVIRSKGSYISVLSLSAVVGITTFNQAQFPLSM